MVGKQDSLITVGKKESSLKTILNLLGIFIFSGLLLTIATTHLHLDAKKIKEFVVFIIGASLVYYFLVNIYFLGNLWRKICMGSLIAISLFNMLLAITLAPVNAYDDNLGYVEDPSISDFPVPVNAIMTTEKTANNSNIERYTYYRLKNIGGNQGLYSPNRYLEEIEAWGWNELEEERMGAKHEFYKDGKIVWLIIEQDLFFVGERKAK